MTHTRYEISSIFVCVIEFDLLALDAFFSLCLPLPFRYFTLGKLVLSVYAFFVRQRIDMVVGRDECSLCTPIHAASPNNE